MSGAGVGGGSSAVARGAPGAALAASTEHAASGLTRLGDFLRAELAWSPARARATARIVLSGVLGTALVMTLQVPHGAWVVVTVFVVSQPDAGATLRKAVQRVFGTLVGCAAALLTLAAAADLPWLHVPFACLVGGFAIFLSRTTTTPYAALLGGLTYSMFALGWFAFPEEAVATGLWRALVISVGVGVVLIVDLFLLPSDPEEQFLGDLERRLGAVEAALARALGTSVAGAAAPAVELRDLVLGLPRELDMLANAEARHAPLRHRHAEQLALILAVERLLTAAVALERVVGAPGVDRVGAPLDARLGAVLEGVARARRCIARRGEESEESGRWIGEVARGEDGAVPDTGVPDAGTDEAEVRGGQAALLAVLVDLEGAARLLDRALGLADDAPGSPGAALPPSPLDAPSDAWLTPAFSLANLADVQLALKTALAQFLVYLLMLGFAWPGIHTAFITVAVIAGTTNGAVMHKALLRISGAALGGVAVTAVIVAAMPNLTSLPGLLLALLPCLALAGWVTAGGPRISYVGVQAGLVLGLGLFVSLGPTTDLEAARDRIVGIMLGDVVGTLVFLALWPVSANREMCRSLAASVRAVAELSRLGARIAAPTAVAPARGYRWQAYQALNQTIVLLDEGTFELDASSAEVTAARAAVRGLVPLVQEALLAALGVVRHRVAVDLSATPANALTQLRACSAAAVAGLDAIAERLAGKEVDPASALPADVPSLLAAAWRTVDEHRASGRATPEEAVALAHVDGRLGLLRDLLALIEQLDREARTAAPAIAAVAGWQRP